MKMTNTLREICKNKSTFLLSNAAIDEILHRAFCISPPQHWVRSTPSNGSTIKRSRVEASKVTLLLSEKILRISEKIGKKQGGQINPLVQG